MFDRRHPAADMIGCLEDLYVESALLQAKTLR
jgi:hypothetical protein